MPVFADLSGKNALVTGSSSGIGSAIAKEFAIAGANVLIHYAHSSDLANQVAQSIRSLGRNSAVLQADFRQLDSLEAFVNAAWDQFGKIDIWVNNAGADVLTGGRGEWTFEKKLQALFEIDVKSTIQLSKLVGQRMVDQAGGAIINIGWDQADRGMEGNSGELFAATKNAIMGFTRSQAVSLAPHVRVNCIAPGWILTAWGNEASDYWQSRALNETPLKRWGTPQDIAKTARFLCSDDASFITGQVINVNGGAVR